MFFMGNQKTNSTRRTSRRIHLLISFEVAGHDENGQHFSTGAQTRNISREGGCLLLDRDLKLGDLIRLKSPKGSLFIAKICWANYDMQRNVRQAGFKLSSNRGWVLHEPSRENSPLFFNRMI